MTKKEITQNEFFEKLKRKEILQKKCAELLNLSVRQVRRKFKKWAKDGTQGLVHGNRGQESNRKYPDVLKDKILDLMDNKYAGFNLTHAKEKFYDCENIQVSRQTIQRYLSSEGKWERKRKSRKHRYWRKPKEHRGEMEQFDGSFHLWVKECKEKWTLIKFIDDATKGIMHARFAYRESVKSVMRCTMEYFKKYGLPRTIYTDKGSTYKVNNHNNENEFITQYQRALGEVGVKLIHANSPQAKGRIERSFQTDQDRLVKEMQLAGIKNMDEANRFLEEVYIPYYNARFMRPAANEIDLHKPLDSSLDLENIFCIKTERTVQNDWTVQYKKRYFQITEKQPVRVKPKDIVIVHEKLDGQLNIFIRKTNLTVIELKERTYASKKVEENKSKIPGFNKGAKVTPWRTTNSWLFK